jgi:hypothetical protein
MLLNDLYLVDLTGSEFRLGAEETIRLQSIRSHYSFMLLNLRTNRNNNGEPVEKPTISILPTAHYF